VSTSLRIAAGVVIGLFAGLVLSTAVVLTRFGPLVNTPRSTHGFLLISLFAVPALAGLVIGVYWPRLRPRR
jgi:hypothetical protein